MMSNKIYSPKITATYLLADTLGHTKCSVKSYKEKIIKWLRKGIVEYYDSETSTSDIRISFNAMISLRIISLLRERKISFADIQNSEKWLKEATGHTHPFATKEIWENQKNIFVNLNNKLIVSNKYGQSVFKEIFEESLESITDLEFDANGSAALWKPYPHIMIRPNIQFGNPCIENTRIPTNSIYGMINGGDTYDDIADSYNISNELIKAAYEWEELLNTK